MMYEWFIAIKHLTKRRYNSFISINFVISIMGVAVGVMALIVVLAVMSGFDRELKTKIVGAQPHIVIEKAGGMDRPDEVKRVIRSLHFPQILSVAPYVQGQAIIRSESNASGVIVRGVNPSEDRLSFFQDQMLDGELNVDDVDVSEKSWFGKENIQTIGRLIVGEELARMLGVSVGDYVSIISPAMDQNSVMALFKRPRSIPFLVSGIFRLGMSDYDTGLALVSVKRGQMLYRLGERVSGVGIRLTDVALADTIKVRIQRNFGAGYVVQSWIDLNRNFFSALKVEKAVMTILLSLIIFVAAFNIVSSLTMMVMEKTKDIGILQALGSTAGAIRRIFLLEGFVIGTFGVIMGAFLGLLIAGNVNPIADFIEKTTGLSVFPKDIYFFDKIPTEINMSDVTMIVVTALIMSLAAGLYPAHQAAKLRPAEALRYE